MNITILAIDIAKNIFQLHGNDKFGKCSYKRRIKRENLLPTIANIAKCTIVMESCGGSNYWYREFTKIGHTVKLISPQYVKPFVKTNKNDANDAQAIAQAASRPSMRYVDAKSIEQQNTQSLHKIRSRLVRNKTQLTNQIRGLLLEYGITINQGYSSLSKALPVILADTDNQLTDMTKDFLTDLYDEFLSLGKKIESYNVKVKQLARSQEPCQRLLDIEGIGELSATAITTTLGEAKNFKNGRHFAAYLGLVPRQNSSGQKTKLLGISKRGNTYLRTLLIHGARSVVANSTFKKDKKSLSIQEKLRRSGYCKTLIAVANKNARVAWSLLANKTKYDVDYNLKQVA